MKESQPYCLCKGEHGSKFKGWTGLTNYLGIETSRERHDLSFRDSNLMRNLALRSFTQADDDRTLTGQEKKHEFDIIETDERSQG